MPQFSAFEPFGFLEFSSQPSHADRIYYSLVNALQGAYDMTVGTRMEAFAYAMAMMLARAQYAHDRAGNQSNPLTAYDLIPLLEQCYIVVPGATANVPQRQLNLSVAAMLARGARPENVVAGLRGLLGSKLLAATNVQGLGATPTVYPASPGATGTAGNWPAPTTPPEWLQLIDPVVETGTPVWCAYESLDTTDTVTTKWQPGTSYPLGTRVIPVTSTGYWYQNSVDGVSATTEPAWPVVIGGTVTDGAVVWSCVATTSPLLQPGQRVTVQGENTVQGESVLVTNASLTTPPGSNASSGLCFQATFTKAHNTGSSLVTGTFPYWWSTQRTIYVVLGPISSSAATDSESRRLADQYLAKVAREVDLWAILRPQTTTLAGSTVTGGTVGPLKIGEFMGTSTIGPYAFTSTP